MLKKYILIGILVITVALAISAFTWVSISRSNGSQFVRTQGLTSLSAADLMALRYTAMAKLYEPVASIAVTGFRTPPISNYASIALTGFRTPPMSSYTIPSIAVTGFRTPPMSNYITLSRRYSGH